MNILQPDMTKGGVRDISNKDPSDLENALPLVRSPHSTAPSVIDRCQHLSHTTEVPASVNTEKEVNRSALCSFLERLVESFVSGISGAPDLILE